MVFLLLFELVVILETSVVHDSLDKYSLGRRPSQGNTANPWGSFTNLQTDIREGDARQTLRDLGGPVDFALIDGWPDGRNPSLAHEVIEIVSFVRSLLKTVS
jgi:hypothetical protein